MKVTIDAELTNYLIDFVPTSIYLDGIQTYAYSLRDTNVFFNSAVPAGTEITFVPADALRILDDGVVTKDIMVTGYHSVFSDPFGAMEFSLDGVTWFKSLSHVFPATVYCRYIPTDAVTDFKCRSDVEVIVWRGNDKTKVNEDGFVEVFESYHAGAFNGGVEYHVF